jgi:hypothetical protein
VDNPTRQQWSHQEDQAMEYRGDYLTIYGMDWTDGKLRLSIPFFIYSAYKKYFWWKLHLQPQQMLLKPQKLELKALMIHNLCHG